MVARPGKSLSDQLQLVLDRREVLAWQRGDCAVHDRARPFWDNRVGRKLSSARRMSFRDGTAIRRGGPAGTGLQDLHVPVHVLGAKP